MSDKTEDQVQDEELLIDPLLPAKAISPAKADAILDRIGRMALEEVDRSIRGGGFSLRSLEAINSATLAMALVDGGKAKVGRKLTVIVTQLKSLREIVKAREEIKLQENMSKRLAAIEEMVGNVKGTKNKQQ